MECGYLAKLWMCVQAKHKPSSQNLSTPHLTPFVWLKCTGVILCRLFLLANAKMVLKAVFSTVSVHICLYVSHVWGAAGALNLMHHTHPNRQHVWAQGLARMTWAWFPQDELQWGLQQPERQRNDKNILCPPPCTCSPSAVSLSTLQRLFSGRPGFLRDGVVEERRKRGMGQRGKDRHRERWIAIGWWSCARSDLGEFIASSCEGVWEQIYSTNLQRWKSLTKADRECPNALLGLIWEKTNAFVHIYVEIMEGLGPGVLYFNMFDKHTPFVHLCWGILSDGTISAAHGNQQR